MKSTMYSVSPSHQRLDCPTGHIASTQFSSNNPGDQIRNNMYCEGCAPLFKTRQKVRIWVSNPPINQEICWLGYLSVHGDKDHWYDHGFAVTVIENCGVAEV